MEVVVKTRLSNKKHGNGALLLWKNVDGVTLRKAVYARIQPRRKDYSEKILPNLLPTTIQTRQNLYEHHDYQKLISA